MPVQGHMLVDKGPDGHSEVKASNLHQQSTLEK